MILTTKDVATKLYEEYPEITKESIDKVCKTGLRGLKKLLNNRDEVIMKHDDYQVKFFIPMTPEKQHDYIALKLWKKKRRDEKSNSK